MRIVPLMPSAHYKKSQSFRPDPLKNFLGLSITVITEELVVVVGLLEQALIEQLD